MQSGSPPYTNAATGIGPASVMSITGTQTGIRVKQITNLGIGAQSDMPGADHEGTLTATNAHHTIQESF